jgi:hypothetical protein
MANVNPYAPPALLDTNNPTRAQKAVVREFVKLLKWREGIATGALVPYLIWNLKQIRDVNRVLAEDEVPKEKVDEIASLLSRANTKGAVRD